MAKLRMFLLVAFIMLLLFAGCTASPGASAGNIIPPQNNNCPLEGKWTVVEELGTNGSTTGTILQWVGSSVQFTAGVMEIGGHVWDNPSFKIKRVNGSDYLMTKYIPLNGISIQETQEVDVVTVHAAANFLGEFMKIDDQTMVSFVQNKAFLLKKTADQADSSLEPGTAKTLSLSQSTSGGTSGVLLGLKIPVGSSYTYRTLWVAVDQQQLRPVRMVGQLFVPRSNGFWELRVEDLYLDGKSANILTARDIAAKALDTSKSSESSNSSESTKSPDPALSSESAESPDPTDEKASSGNDEEPAVRVIDYIGNDYVAIEKEAGGISKLQVLPIDKLSSPSGIKISDLLGYKGLNAYNSARARAAAEIGVSEQEGTLLNEEQPGENFGLVRKNGHWYLIGRIHYINGDAFDWKDFSLNIIPPAKWLFYDTLALSWQIIKDRVPGAVDAFTSPNKCMALLITKNKIYIYTIEADQLAGKALAEIDLLEGTSVIMAEWATGSHVVNSWEEAFISYGAELISGGLIRSR